MTQLFNKKVLCTGVLLLLYLASQRTARADPILLHEKIKEVGNNVEATFDVKDSSSTAFAGLPRTVLIQLVEVSGLNQVVGSATLPLNPSNTTQNNPGYITSSAITITFRNASNAVTGTGSNYALQLTPIPEPATLLLLGTGFAGFAIKMRKNSEVARADKEKR